MELKEQSKVNTWQKLEEIDHFLQKNRPTTKVVIIIDDLEQWIFHWSKKGADFKRELTDYIAEHTQLHSIYWLVTLLDTKYDKITDQKSQDQEEKNEMNITLTKFNSTLIYFKMLVY